MGVHVILYIGDARRGTRTLEMDVVFVGAGPANLRGAAPGGLIARI